jgi:hypothetical protein
MQTNPLANLSLKKLKRAVAVREKIERLETLLGRMLDGGSSRAAAPPKRRKLSAAAKAKISAAAKARWQRFRAQKAKK